MSEGQVRFDDRVAIVTGAGRGIGREHALLLAARGARVVVNDLGTEPDATGASEEPARSVVAEIHQLDGEAVPDANSVASPEGAEAIVRTALEAFGRLDIVINNAGVTQTTWERMLTVHLSGTYWVTRAAWPHLRDNGYGRVLNTTSGAGLFGRRWEAHEGAEELGQYAYAAAKMGIVGLTRNLAHEGRPIGINVNAIAPGALTRLTRGAEDERVVSWLEKHAGPQHVAPLAAWLVHENCEVSGEVFSTSGGRFVRVFVAETRGYYDPGLTIEDVRDNIHSACDETGYDVPRSTLDEGRLFAQAIGGSR